MNMIECLGLDFLDEEEELTITKVKTFSYKPMSPEEAILQMNLLNHQFFVFIDIETQKVCVVYKRHENTGPYKKFHINVHDSITLKSPENPNAHHLMNIQYAHYKQTRSVPRAHSVPSPMCLKVGQS